MNTANFEKLSPRRFGPRSTSPAQDLAETEEVIGMRLPEALREIVLRTEGATTFDVEVCFVPKETNPVQGDEGRIGFELIYGPSDDTNGFKQKFSVYKDQLPEDLVAFGECAGGNLVCLGKATLEVMFWIHDSSPEEQSTFLVADSFENFLDGLLVGPFPPSTLLDKVIPSETYFDF